LGFEICPSLARSDSDSFYLSDCELLQTFFKVCTNWQHNGDLQVNADIR